MKAQFFINFYLMNLLITPKVINDDALSINDGLIQINLSIYEKYSNGNSSKINVLKLNMTSSASIPFSIKTSREVDVVDGLKFVLHQ